MVGGCTLEWPLLQRFSFLEEVQPRGTFSQMFRAWDESHKRNVFVKVSDSEKVEIEHKALEALSASSAAAFVPHVFELLQLPVQSVLVLDLFGENLARLAGGHLCAPTVSYVGAQMVSAIAAIQKAGYVHRNIQPSSFAWSADGAPSKIVLLDFGFACCHLEQSGRPKKPHLACTFRGNLFYASPNAHACKDLGRRDDFYGLAYCLFEFSTGPLPWSEISAHAAAVHMEKGYLGYAAHQISSGDKAPVHPDLIKVRDYLAAAPHPLLEFLLSLNLLDYYSEPNYESLIEILKKLDPRGEGAETVFQEMTRCKPPAAADSSVSADVGADKTIASPPVKRRMTCKTTPPPLTPEKQFPRKKRESRARREAKLKWGRDVAKCPHCGLEVSKSNLAKHCKRH